MKRDKVIIEKREIISIKEKEKEKEFMKKVKMKYIDKENEEKNIKENSGKKVKVILLEVSAQSIVLLGRRHRRRRRRRRAHLAPRTAIIQRVDTGDYI